MEAFFAEELDKPRATKGRYRDGLLGDQPEAFETIIGALEAGKTVIKLIGNAGTGKTFLVSRLAMWAQDHGYDVVLAAPTHKAAGVIREKLSHLSVEVSTIHSLLGFSLPMDLDTNSGKRKLVKKRNTEIKGLVICDEGSMIGAVLLEEIQNKRNVQWLFVGDDAQLAPVGEGPSELLENPDARLGTVLRQAQESEILRLATAIRHGDLSFDFEGGKDVFAVGSAADLFEAAHDAFKRPEYKDDASYARMLVFRNETRRQINEQMRRLLVGSDEPYVEGEWLVMYNPFSAPTDYKKGGRRFLSVAEIFEQAKRLKELADEAKQNERGSYGWKRGWREFFNYKERFGSRLLYTSQEVIIEDAVIDVASVDEDWFPAFKIWKLKIKADGQVLYDMPVLDPGQYDRFREALDDQRRHAMRFAARLKEEPDNKEIDEERREAWRRYFMLEEMFAHVDRAYCMTTHKSQGSTFQHVFVDVPDILSSSMKQRLSYVAVTRAAKTLTFNRG